MSSQIAKTHRTQRRQRSLRQQQRQQRIARLHNLPLKPAHYYNKHHALDCGNPQCVVCGNPRRTHKHTLTLQEQRLFQDTQ